MKQAFRRLDHHIKELLSGAALALTVKSGAALVSIILGIVLGRLLGPDGAGLYYTTVTIVTIASTLGCVGLNNSLVRFIAANKVAGDLSAVRGVYRWATLIASVVSILIGASVSLGSQWLANDVYRIPELARPLFWAGLAIPACTLIIIHAQALQGLKRVTASMAVLSLYAPTVSVILILFLAPSFGALGAVAARVLLVEEAANALIGSRLDDAALDGMAAICSQAASPIDDKRGTVEFRKKVAGVLAKRAAQIAVNRATETS